MAILLLDPDGMMAVPGGKLSMLCSSVKGVDALLCGAEHSDRSMVAITSTLWDGPPAQPSHVVEHSFAEYAAALGLEDRT